MKPILCPSTIVALALTACVAQAADKNKAWTDPVTARREDPDFSIQGEYGSDREGASLGAQVVALGDGRFEAYFLKGGLPGLGWTKGKERVRVAGTFKKDIVLFESDDDEIEAIIRDGRIKGRISGERFNLPRIERQSPTLGRKPPKGAVVLFDGSSAEGWKNGKLVEGLLAATGTTSEKTFKDCEIHLEFRAPYKPLSRGQGRGNSGVYYGGRWETQVLDSFGLDGRMNETGGIYSIAEPKLNMCLPPLTWQTYDVAFTAAKFAADGKMSAWPRITVRLNGVVVHEDQELNKTHTTAAPITGELKDEGGPIFLQDHGNPVFFRNIWVLPK